MENMSLNESFRGDSSSKLMAQVDSQPEGGADDSATGSSKISAVAALSQRFSGNTGNKISQVRKAKSGVSSDSKDCDSKGNSQKLQLQTNHGADIGRIEIPNVIKDAIPISSSENTLGSSNGSAADNNNSNLMGLDPLVSNTQSGSNSCDASSSNGNDLALSDPPSSSHGPPLPSISSAEQSTSVEVVVENDKVIMQSEGVIIEEVHSSGEITAEDTEKEKEKDPDAVHFFDMHKAKEAEVS
jgi:hypothetical protein